MPIAPALQRFIDDELARAPALIERTLNGTLQLLRDGKDAPLAASDRAHRLALLEALNAHGADYERVFVQALRDGVREALQEHQGGGAQEPDSAGAGLELMDESRVEIDIEISRAIQLIDTTAEWELRELQTFTSTLIGQTHVSAESNPLRPQVYATALWHAACAVSALPAQRTTLLKVSSGVMAGLLKNAWAAACTRLESQGVEPGIYRTVVINPGSAPGRGPAPPDVNVPSAMADLLASMPSGSPKMQVGVTHAGVAPGTAAPVTGAGASAELEKALARLDELVRRTSGDAPQLSATDRTERLQAQRAALVAGASSPTERQIVELVSRVFDAIASDTQIAAPFVALLARLRTSALRVALRDPDMVTSTRHAVWHLFDRIGEIGQTAPSPADTHGATLLALCKALTDQLASTPGADAVQYRRALSQLDTLLANQLQARLQAAQPAVHALNLAERRELIEGRLSQRLAEQMASVRTSAGIRRFVTGAWAKVLAEAMVRDGEQAQSTHDYIKLVDELLWSVQLPDHPKSRQRLIGLLPGMLKRLRSGMEMIKLPATEQSSVLDELMAIHTEALRPTPRTDPAALTPQQIVQRMRDEVLPPTTGQGGFSDSVIDIASMETVPAELLPTGSTGLVTESPKRVDALRPGVRLRLFLRGRWTRVQLLWRSEQGLLFLFGAEASARTYSVTQRALERLSGAGLMQSLELRPLVQRALDAVMRDASRLS